MDSRSICSAAVSTAVGVGGSPTPGRMPAGYRTRLRASRRYFSYLLRRSFLELLGMLWFNTRFEFLERVRFANIITGSYKSRRIISLTYTLARNDAALFRMPSEGVMPNGVGQADV
jgi:hypothetical protein